MTENLKELVGKKAAELVKDGMIVGLGTGSTVAYTIQELARRVNEEGLKFQGVATSIDTEKKAGSNQIELVDINEVEKLNLAIDGADEVDKNLNLIKGGGGALTREKIVDYMAEKFVVIIDESKHKEILGDFPIPVEVLRFSWFQCKSALENLGASVSMRMLDNKKTFMTDNGNYILDAKFSHVMKPERLEQIINNVPGVIGNGIFRKDQVSEVWIGTKEGIKVLN